MFSFQVCCVGSAVQRSRWCAPEAHPTELLPTNKPSLGCRFPGTAPYVIALNALFSTYLSLYFLLNLKQARKQINVIFQIQKPIVHFYRVPRSIWHQPILKGGIEVLLGSLSGFNHVSLLEALEAVLEYAALWLQGSGTTDRVKLSGFYSHFNHVR